MITCGELEKPYVIAGFKCRLIICKANSLPAITPVMQIVFYFGDMVSYAAQFWGFL